MYATLLLLLAAYACAGSSAAATSTMFSLTFQQGEAERSSAGVFRVEAAGGGLVRQLWANRATPGRHTALRAETLTVGWDGIDGAGADLLQAEPTTAFEIRWLDTSNVKYDWHGVVGNSGPATGQNVLRSEGWQNDLAIAGKVGVRAWGYNEAGSGCSLFSTSTPSHTTSIAHSDYHRTFALTATDGKIGYFVDTGGTTAIGSFFATGATFVIGVDLQPKSPSPGPQSRLCEHNFTAAGRPQCTMGDGQVPGGTVGNWSFCKPAGSRCAYPGSDCANGGATKDNYDGCNGYGEYFHSVIDFSHDRTLVNDSANGLNPRCTPTPTKRCNGTGDAFLHAATGIAVQRGSGNNKLFIAHAFLHELRVLDKSTGASMCNVTMEMPRRMSVSEDGTALWVIVGNTSVAKFDTATLCTSGGKPTATVMLPTAQLVLPVALSVSPTTGDVAVADASTSQVHLFAADGKYLKSFGQKGGYATGGPQVSAERFFWLPTQKVFMAHESDGSLWVADGGNLRTLHVDSNGKELGLTEYVVASYSSAVISAQPTRVFSNYREYDVQYSGGATPLNQSWKLVRNWAAGLDANWTVSNAGFEGFHQVEQTSDNKTIGLVSMANSTICLAELPSDGRGLRVIQQQPSGVSLSLERGCALRYSKDFWHRGSQAMGLQEIWEVPYDVEAGNWTFPGKLVSSFPTASDQLASRSSGVHPTFPTTAAGEFIIFDGGVGKNESYDNVPNQGYHLGVAGKGANSTFKWQASRWGTWDVAGTPIVLDGINCTFNSITNADGRFGANDASIQYAGSYALVSGHSIVYGFFGEFWKDSEANQFLHFHDSGLFVGQFGTLSQFGNLGLNPKIPRDRGGEFETFNYALPGEAGNSFGPSLVVAPDGLTYFYHNDESKHDGVHQWTLTGAEDLVLR